MRRVRILVLCLLLAAGGCRAIAHAAVDALFDSDDGHHRHHRHHHRHHHHRDCD